MNIHTIDLHPVRRSLRTPPPVQLGRRTNSVKKAGYALLQSHVSLLLYSQNARLFPGESFLLCQFLDVVFFLYFAQGRGRSVGRARPPSKMENVRQQRSDASATTRCLGCFQGEGVGVAWVLEFRRALPLSSAAPSYESVESLTSFSCCDATCVCGK